MNELAIHSKIIQARQFAEDGKILHAIQELEAVVRDVPSSEAAWWELAHLYIDGRRYAAAERTIVRAVAVVRNKVQFDFLLAKLHFVNGEKGKALVELTRLDGNADTLSIPLRAEVSFYLGIIERDRNRHSAAEMMFTRTRALEPQFPRINESIAELQFVRGALNEADANLERAVVIDPTSWFAFHLKGMIQMKRGKTAEALQHFETAVDLNPDESSLWEKCGEALLLLERCDEAERYLRKAMKMNDKHVDTLVTFGRLLVRKRQFADAREMISQALHLEPANKEARAVQREIEQYEREKSR